jgi:mitogen-activated protein kinase kinase
MSAPAVPNGHLPIPRDARLPTYRSVSEAATTSGMTASSTPLGSLNAARRPAATPTISSRDSGLNVSQDILARIQAVHLGRKGPPLPNTNRQQPVPPTPQGSLACPTPVSSGAGVVPGPGGVPSNFQIPGKVGKPAMVNYSSAPAVPNIRTAGPKLSLAEKRGQMLQGGLPGSIPANGSPSVGRKKPDLRLSRMNGNAGQPNDDGGSAAKPATMMDKYADYIDTKTGTLRFKEKAIINSQGVQFSGGSTFSISLDEVDTLDELGKGNYGTVYKVRHSRPRIRKPGQGLAGNKVANSASSVQQHSPTFKKEDNESSPTAAKPATGTGVVMAMKEIRLELDDAKFAAIIMELDILHRCVSPYIVDFYGAFFQEGAVYICIEFMDGGSIDKLYADGVPENVLRKITLSTTMGLKFLKEEHNIIHRDVKPTNILVNTKGQVKICDFGVSGNLVASIAKTNIGCQSYMAPERISSGGIAQAGANPGGGTYSVQSDIWSLGLTIIECAMGRYPYPPETYNNIFSQLSVSNIKYLFSEPDQYLLTFLKAIVDGEPPDLPNEGFSDAARDFVRGCLNKVPGLRPTYAMLLQHAWLAPLVRPETILEADEDEEAEADGQTNEILESKSAHSPVVDSDVADWVKEQLEKKKNGTLGKGGKAAKPALHAAPLDAVGSPQQEVKGPDEVKAES